MPGRSKLENTHFWLLGKHCRTQSLCSFFLFFLSTFTFSHFIFSYLIFSYFILSYFVLFIFQMSVKTKLEDTCLTYWKTLLNTNFKFNFFTWFFLFNIFHIFFFVDVLSPNTQIKISNPCYVIWWEIHIMYFFWESKWVVKSHICIWKVLAIWIK